MKNILLKPIEQFKRLQERPLSILERLVSRRNAIMLMRLISGFIVLVAIYSIIFHYLMLHEGKTYHWLVGIYWTLTTMTTLGYGDIVFVSLKGMMFTIVVLLSGIFFLLVIVPFTLIQLFQSSARVPREAPSGISNHIILTHYGPVTSVLIEKLGYYSYPYVLLSPDLEHAVQLRDKNLRSILGELDDPQSYIKAGIEKAALLAVTNDDITNTIILHAARQASSTISTLAVATEPESNDILTTAGATEILTLDEMMGQSLARRTIAGDAIAHTIGQFESLTIAEAAACATPLVNKKLKETELRQLTGVAVIGIFEGPHFHLPTGDFVIHKNSILVLAGTEDSIARYNELFCIYNSSDNPVVVVGAGNVGRWVARSLQENGLQYQILEKNAEKAFGVPNVLVADAARKENLERAGFFKAPAVVIATHNDDTNVYLATLFRYLRSDIQIVSRATLERNVSLLHQAGCDIVLSYASFGANFIINHLKRGLYLMLSDGVDVFKVKTPKSLEGKTIADAALRETIGCHVVGIVHTGMVNIATSNTMVFEKDSEVILIASNRSEAKFIQLYGKEI